MQSGEYRKIVPSLEEEHHVHEERQKIGACNTPRPYVLRSFFFTKGCLFLNPIEIRAKKICIKTPRSQIKQL